MNPLRPAALAVALGLVMLPARPALAASVSVSPTSGLNPSGATVSVSGSGFDAKGNNGNGVYVVFGPKAGNKDAGAFGAAKWIRPGAGMSEKGSFGTSLSIKAQYTDGHGKKVDCGKTACYIITMAAHGSSDRSQDTFTRVTFKAAAKPKPKPKPTKTATPTPSPTSASPSPSKTTEKPKASPKPTESATPTATASPTPAPATSVESLTAKPAASSEKDSGTTWPYWAAAAAIVAVGGAFFLLRRRQS